jgi:predicted secreted protein
VNVVTGIMVYVIVWWLVLFTVLPFGNRAPDEVQPGTVESAPERPRLWIKALVTTVIASLIWGVIYWIIESDLITFRS